MPDPSQEPPDPSNQSRLNQILLRVKESPKTWAVGIGFTGFIALATVLINADIIGAGAESARSTAQSTSPTTSAATATSTTTTTSTSTVPEQPLAPCDLHARLTPRTALTMTQAEFVLRWNTAVDELVGSECAYQLPNEGDWHLADSTSGRFGQVGSAYALGFVGDETTNLTSAVITIGAADSEPATQTATELVLTAVFDRGTQTELFDHTVEPCEDSQPFAGRSEVSGSGYSISIQRCPG